MKKSTFLLSLTISLANFALSQHSTQSQLIKPIICLTYDDGLATQLSTAIPQLDSAGFKATFFLTSIQGSSQSDVIGQTPEVVLGWHNAAKNGHELANHTLFHPCPMNLGWDKALAIDHYTVKQVLDEIATQNTLLSLLNPERKKRAYAFPCNNSVVEGRDYSQLLKEKKTCYLCKNRRRQYKYHHGSGSPGSDESALVAGLYKHNGRSTYFICRKSKENRRNRNLPVSWNRRADLSDFRRCSQRIS
jgi:hypothetical protein